VPEPSDSYNRSGQYVALAWDFFGTIVAGTVIGWFADEKLGTQPWVLVVATLVAVVGGFVRLISGLRRLDRLDHGP
jgi:F0F1-type ATP synthase assembly protein I